MRLGADRTLRGVLVTVSEFEGTVEHEPKTHDVEVRDCRIAPTLVVATRGDTLRLTNHSPGTFFPTVQTDVFHAALLPDQSREVPLERLGVTPLECRFGPPCGRAEIVVVNYPVHTVTGEGGRFRLDNVPIGEEVELAAWHPLLAETMQRVTVPAEGLHDLRIEVGPTVAPAPTEPAPEVAPHPEDQPGLF